MGREGGLVALLCWACRVPPGTSATFKSLNGLHHIKHTGVNCLRAIRGRRASYLGADMYGQISYQRVTESDDAEVKKKQTPKGF